MIIWIVLTGDVGDYLSFLGFGDSVPALGWILAVAVAVVYTVYTLVVIPICRKTAVEISGFRLLAIPLAIMSGVIKEAFFRKVVMDALESSASGSSSRSCCQRSCSRPYTSSGWFSPETGAFSSRS